MKTNKNTITKPELFINSAHGIYIPQIFAQQIDEHYKKQIDAQVLADLSSPENEFYWDAWNYIEGKLFKTPTGQKIFFLQPDGDLWVVPACYIRTKEYKENWNNY